MTLIVSVGKNGELLFNRRRCSSDRAVTADIGSMFDSAALCVSAYSAPLFEGAHIIASLEEVGDGIVFLEDFPLLPALAQAQKIIVYRFDRTYPADVRVQIPQDFSLTEKLKFAGFSHDKITREVYQR